MDKIRYGYQGQLCGPFATDDNIFTIIKEQIKKEAGITDDNFDITITHLGIQAKPGTIVNIEGNEFYISQKKILEFNYLNDDDYKISSIFFSSGADNTTIIDYTFKADNTTIIDYTFK